MFNPLDITTAILGLIYILLEWKGSIWMWAVGAVMQALGLVLYYQSGLYADCGMEIYYLIMTLYGFLSWKYGKPLFKKNNTDSCSFSHSQTATKENAVEYADTVRQPKSPSLPVTHIPIRLALLWMMITAVIWAAIYYMLATFTDSNVPLADSFTTALSIVGIWALAHKYLEQWFIWIAVDIVTSALYFYKDLPFKALLYALYVIIAFFGYFNWKKKMSSQN